jgi:hypothetical protein
VIQSVGEGGFKAESNALPTGKIFDNPAETAMVPGPCRIPTPAFPILPAPAGVGANALMFHRTSPPGEAGFPTASGRAVMPPRQ